MKKEAHKEDNGNTAFESNQEAEDNKGFWEMSGFTPSSGMGESLNCLASMLVYGQQFGPARKWWDNMYSGYAHESDADEMLFAQK